MSSITSSDGTTISYDRSGDGPPVIVVLGAFNTRETGAPLAAHLAARFTVVNYDRRGRGASTDTMPYAVDREIDDLAALISTTGSAAVFGYSSGAALAIRAAARGLPITKLALYDPTVQIPGTSPDSWTELARQVDDLVSAAAAATPLNSSRPRRSAYRPKSLPSYGRPPSGPVWRRSPTPLPTSR